MARLTKKGALHLTDDIDRVANVLVAEHKTLGISQKFATALAYNLDTASGQIERAAGIQREANGKLVTAIDGFDPVKEQGFDPEDIGVEQAGPLVGDADESYMKGEFSQQENRELREKVETGDINSAKADPDPQAPQPGKQAGWLLKAADMLSVVSAKTVGSPIGKSAAAMAKDLLSIRAALIAGRDGGQATRALKAAADVVPHLHALVNGKQAGDTAKLERLAALGASVIGKLAGEEKKDDAAAGEEVEEKKDDAAAAKKAGEEKKDDAAAGEDDEVAATKKAYEQALAKQAAKSKHGYNLAE